MAPVYDFSPIDCGLCAAVLAAKAKKANEPEPPPGSVPSHLVRRVSVTWDRFINIKLSVCFINEKDVPTDIQKKIIGYANYWTKPDAVASIQLEKMPYSRKCDIRVRVTKEKDANGNELVNQSMLGTASRDYQIDKNDPDAASMELAILDVEDGPNKNGVNMFRRRVLHEFGHAFGFDHEGERDDFQQFLKKEFRTENPNTATGESDATTKPVVPPVLSDIQIQASQIANKSLVRSSVPDRKSIMMYPFNEKKVIDVKDVIPWNDVLSAEDKSFSNQIYPPVPQAVPV